MYIRELSLNEFEQFASSHPLNNYAQSTEYALLMSECGFDYELIGYDSNGKLLAASLILYKNINGINIGYSPKGFLIDYSDENLIKDFTNDLKKYYYKKKFALIKINPEIPIAVINSKTFEASYNQNIKIKETLINNGFFKLKDNLYFESMFPRFSGMISYSTFKPTTMSKNTKNKIKKGMRKGLSFQKVDSNYIKYLNQFTAKQDYFYEDFYNIFSRNDKIDLFITSLDYDSYLENSQIMYNKEYDRNQELNLKMTKKPTPKNINRKMNSDIALLTYKKDIMEATKLVNNLEPLVLGAILVVKHANSVKIVASGYDKNFKRFVPNYFMYYNVLKYYNKSYSFLDLNGLSGDFSNESPFNGLNKFKIGFNPKIYEFIGEFDLIIEPKAYNYLLKTGKVVKEFSQKY